MDEQAEQAVADGMLMLAEHPGATLVVFAAAKLIERVGPHFEAMIADVQLIVDEHVPDGTVLLACQMRLCTDG